MQNVDALVGSGIDSAPGGAAARETAAEVDGDQQTQTAGLRADDDAVLEPAFADPQHRLTHLNVSGWR